jgi:hypothetical protein
MKKLLSSLSRIRIPGITISKRQQFVAVTLLLTLILVATQLFSDSLRFDLLFFLGIAAYILSALVLRYELRGWEYLTLLILPSFYTAAVFLFYFLLPTRWLTRLPIAILYAIGMYAILLTENIYNVAAERTIQLIRAAHSVGFLLSLVTMFFLMDTALSLRLPFYLNVIITLCIVFPLALQALWSMELTATISANVLSGSLVIALLIMQLVLIFSFWPIKTTIEALFITTVFYSLVGMTQQYLIGRLFANTFREFLAVLLLVFILVIFTTRWGVGIQ